MRVHMKKHPTEEIVTVTLRVPRSKVLLLRQYAESIKAGDEKNFSIAETFPEYMGKEQEVALRAYRNREGLTQKRLAEMTGIPQHHISEMENGKRSIGKERAKRLAEALNCDYRRLL
ncbi:antitoxin, XRE family [Geotalea daltonii FRC-32]|uniref:Antitoxin, XRE family n=1 Tax=Geotalea daltonii (strain DSM 22248 / JCM 15807 / FRC-32) TaxID=316067 RepID=B9LZ25_GEODF|nr:helix-turn-helix transcriptional regulator [Geotalea daltonii]ACM18757.1 antitoxin, XRE family [Geotalea daltonii FRC-32]